MNEPAPFCNNANDSQALADPARWVAAAVARCGECVNHAAHPDWQGFCIAAARVLAYQGLATLDDPKRLRNALNDCCKGAFKREINVSLLCASAGILAQCARHSGTAPGALHIQHILSVLTGEHGVDPDLAVFITGVWSTLGRVFSDASPRRLALARSAPSQPVVPSISTPTRKAGDTQTVNLGSGVTLEMVWCPPGKFLMGSPLNERGRNDNETQHHVTLSEGFWIGKYPVTQRQWIALMGRNPSYFKKYSLGLRTNEEYLENPVDQIIWDDCQKFIQKLNIHIQRGGFRLPTEAEWEYACRAGTSTALYNGKELTNACSQCCNVDEIAWYGSNSDKRTHPVGKKLPNAWGLHDMAGNVCEWCHAGSIIRGGGWCGAASFCRSAYRDTYCRFWLFDRNSHLGMRLARDSD